MKLYTCKDCIYFTEGFCRRNPYSLRIRNPDEYWCGELARMGKTCVFHEFGFSEVSKVERPYQP